MLNHVEPGVTAVYDRHFYDREKREALDAWATKLFEIVAATGVIDSTDNRNLASGGEEP